MFNFEEDNGTFGCTAKAGASILCLTNRLDRARIGLGDAPFVRFVPGNKPGLREATAGGDGQACFISASPPRGAFFSALIQRCIYFDHFHSQSWFIAAAASSGSTPYCRGIASS